MKKFSRQLEATLCCMQGKRGSALVMAMLFMMLLLVLSFSVNLMLLSEVRAERNFLSGVKAYYAAEAGVETALLDVSFADAGESVLGTPVPVPFVSDAAALNTSITDDDQTYAYEVNARTTEFTPCVFESRNDDGYGVLQAGESVVIPLNSVENPENGADITSFQVDYYIVDTNSPFDTPSWVMQHKDVMRWKIIGNRNFSGKVEAISDYFPISDINHNYPNNPTRFGTSNTENFDWDTGKYYDILDGVTFDTADLIYLDISAYIDNFADGGFHYIFHANYPIDDFLASHENNLLVLTNFLNTIPADVPDADVNPADSYELYYRVHDGIENSPEDEQAIACTSVKVSADGVSPDGKFVQTLDVVKPLDQGIPVTDFVWYQRD